jgi:hypothetical protein
MYVLDGSIQNKIRNVQPPMKKATAKDVVDVVLYLARAGHVSGEILHVDGPAPARRCSRKTIQYRSGRVPTSYLRGRTSGRQGKDECRLKFRKDGCMISRCAVSQCSASR